MASSGKLLGCTEPRIFTPPLRELTPETSLGFALIEFAVEVLHVEFLPWERWLFIHALELKPNGRFRFRIIVAIIARQNGKTMMSQVLASFFLWVLGVKLVLGTSLSLDQAEEVWEGVVQWAMENDELAETIERVSRTNGSKSLTLDGFRRYKVSATKGTAEKKGGRGKSIDLLLLDELREHTTWKAWGATTKATLARPNAQIWCISNAGEEDAIVLRTLRIKAHARLGDPDGVCRASEYMPDDQTGVAASSFGFFEWSAPPAAGVWDRDGWAQANPSLGYGFLEEEALAVAAATDDEAVFRTECLCQWVAVQVVPPFPEGAWDAGKDEASRLPKGADVAFGFDVSGDRTTASIAVCGMREDGLWHVELVARRVGVDWAVRWFSERAANGKKSVVAIQGRGAPASAYADDLEKVEGLSLVKCEGSMLGAWCGRFYDGVCAADDAGDSDAVPIVHRPQGVLDEAAATAQKKSLGDGAFMWDRSKSRSDCAPLAACTLAFGAVALGKAEAPKRLESAYAARGMYTI